MGYIADTNEHTLREILLRRALVCMQPLKNKISMRPTDHRHGSDRLKKRPLIDSTPACAGA